MKKILIVSLSLIIVGLLSLFVFLFIFVKDSPVAIIARSSDSNPNNQYYLNGQRVGDNKGFCRAYRNGVWDIELKQGNQKQIVRIQQLFGFKMDISQPAGDDLALQVVSANADQALRQEYNCNF